SAPLTSFVNQPPICTPVFVDISGLMLNPALNSSHSACPPPKWIQAAISSAVKPNGTAAKKIKGGEGFSQKYSAERDKSATPLRTASKNPKAPPRCSPP